MRGGARLNFLIVMVLLITVGFLGYQLVPVYYRASLFQSFMQDTVSNAAMLSKPPTWVEQQLRGSAEDYGVPRDAVIEVTPRAGRMEARVAYTRPIPLVVTTYQYKFDYTAKSAALLSGGD